MYRREVIDRKIVDLQRILASTDDQLTITLLNMEIESFESERDSLLQTEHRKSAGLRELDGWDRPFPVMASNRYSQAMHFVEPNFFYRTGFSVGKDHGFANKLALGLLELAEDRGRTDLRRWHKWSHRGTASYLPEKVRKSWPGTSQTSVGGNRSTAGAHSLGLA
jgi:hypothetical protein